MAKTKLKILQELEAQTALWIVLGIGAAIIYPILFFSWDFISSLNLIIPLLVIAASGTIVWWFWTMKIIFTVLKLQKNEHMSFQEIVKEIKEIREEIREEIRKHNPL
jgi:hypothetical protein